MRRIGFYIVVGLCAGLLWAGISSTATHAAPAAPSLSPVISQGAPLKQAALFQWSKLECDAGDAISFSGGANPTNWDIDFDGSALVTNYIICPILQGIYGGVGLIVNAVEASGLLKIEPLFTGGTVTTEVQKGLYGTWGVMRDFANVGLVIGLFAVIFSQATSYGLSAYGVKKLLPKIVIAAILINGSYIICAILIDIFNILGSTLDDTILGAINTSLRGSADIGDMISQASAAATGSLLIGGFWSLLVFPLLMGVVFLILFIIGLCAIFFLVARQVLAVVLVVISPLAFIAWLFPNTEKHFKKWWTVFIRLLAIYPVVMCLKVLSYIIVVALAALIGVS